MLRRIPLLVRPMSIFSLARAASLVSGMLVCAFVAAAQAAPSDPDSFVASVYANGREGVVWSQWLDGARRREWFSHSLTTLWANCDALARETKDELGPVDFDVATNSQGMEVKRFTIKTLSHDALHASVVARLAPNNWARKSEWENKIRYDLVWELGSWKIDDIHSVIEPNTWSLRGILTRYLRHEDMKTLLRVLVLAFCSGLPVAGFAGDPLDEVRRSFTIGGKPIPPETRRLWRRHDV